RAGADGKAVVVIPVAFVSEHSETRVELDMDYARLARECGVPDYCRVPTVGARAPFIAGLARLVRAASYGKTVSGAGERVCPATFGACPIGSAGRPGNA